jgi:hypothetical protein
MVGRHGYEATETRKNRINTPELIMKQMRQIYYAVHVSNMFI